MKDNHWSVFVSDHHEFEVAKDFYRQAGWNTKHEEVGCHGLYEAIFWMGKKPAKLIQDKKNTYRKMFDDYSKSNQNSL